MDLFDQFEAELALCRGTICAIAALTAAAIAVPAARRRRRLRAAAIAAIAAIAITAGAASAAVVFTIPAPALQHVGYHAVSLDYDHDGD